MVFANRDGLLYSVSLDIDEASGRVTAGIPQPLFDIGYISSDDRWHMFSADGERILLREFDARDVQLPLHLVQNWPAILERRR